MEDASDVQFGTYWPQQQTVSPALYGYYYPEYGNIDQQQLAEIQQASETTGNLMLKDVSLHNLVFTSRSLARAAPYTAGHG